MLPALNLLFDFPHRFLLRLGVGIGVAEVLDIAAFRPRVAAVALDVAGIVVPLTGFAVVLLFWYWLAPLAAAAFP